MSYFSYPNFYHGYPVGIKLRKAFFFHNTEPKISKGFQEQICMRKKKHEHKLSTRQKIALKKKKNIAESINTCTK